MKFELFSRAALAVDVPEHGLLRGDLVTIVEAMPANEHHPAGYVVEINDVLGNTLGVVGLLESQLTALRFNNIPAMRELAVAA